MVRFTALVARLKIIRQWRPTGIPRLSGQTTNIDGGDAERHSIEVAEAPNIAARFRAAISKLNITRRRPSTVGITGNHPHDDDRDDRDSEGDRDSDDEVDEHGHHAIQDNDDLPATSTIFGRFHHFISQLKAARSRMSGTVQMTTDDDGDEDEDGDEVDDDDSDSGGDDDEPPMTIHGRFKRSFSREVTVHFVGAWFVLSVKLLPYDNKVCAGTRSRLSVLQETKVFLGLRTG